MTTDRIVDANGILLALVVTDRPPAATERFGIEFLTGPEHVLQVGVMRRPEGYVIQPHVHLPVLRESVGTPEVLFIRQGRVSVDFYDAYQVKVWSMVVEAGDVLILLAGGHGFTMLTEAVIEEVKVGPHLGDADKVKF